MKIQLLVVGKTSAGYLREGIDSYVKRIGHYMPFEIVTIQDLKSTKSLTFDQQKEKEGEAINALIKGGDYVVLLDERGKEMTSRQFAQFIEQKSITVTKNLTFVIGGPYGFSKSVYERADAKMSFSQMTFSHEMIRLFFVEQLYRAMTILRGEPYHHD